MFQEDFGLRLKQFRRQKKLTQLQISKQLNISRQAYSNYEQGRCLPPPDKLAELSLILNTNLFIQFIQYAAENLHISPIPRHILFDLSSTNEESEVNYEEK